MLHKVERILPYRPDQLFELVGDVDRYPEFVPWIVSLRTWNGYDWAPGINSVDAEATVRFTVLQERFATRVRRDSTTHTIDVSLLQGPFKKLSNRWRFFPHPGGSFLEFTIDFEFKLGLLDRVLHANSDHAVSRLIACFEDRAKDLYGGV